jgi:hypothetical protein
MVEANDDKVASNGFGLAGFLLALNSLGARVRNGEMTLTEAADIISRSRRFLVDSFPGDARVASFAENALKLAEQMLSAASAQKPSGGPN